MYVWETGKDRMSMTWAMEVILPALYQASVGAMGLEFADPRPTSVRSRPANRAKSQQRRQPSAPGTDPFPTDISPRLRQVTPSRASRLGSPLRSAAPCRWSSIIGSALVAAQPGLQLLDDLLVIEDQSPTPPSGQTRFLRSW